MGERKLELGLGFKTGGEEKLERVVMGKGEEVPRKKVDRRRSWEGGIRRRTNFFNGRNVY